VTAKSIEINDPQKSPAKNFLPEFAAVQSLLLAMPVVARSIEATLLLESRRLIARFGRGRKYRGRRTNIRSRRTGSVLRHLK
jgi:hypothetical protein